MMRASHVFRQQDKDRSGNLDKHEFYRCLQSLGYESDTFSLVMFTGRLCSYPAYDKEALFKVSLRLCFCQRFLLTCVASVI